jgi:hypothetical protein
MRFDAHGLQILDRSECLGLLGSVQYPRRKPDEATTYVRAQACVPQLVTDPLCDLGRAATFRSVRDRREVASHNDLLHPRTNADRGCGGRAQRPGRGGEGPGRVVLLDSDAPAATGVD